MAHSDPVEPPRGINHNQNPNNNTNDNNNSSQPSNLSSNSQAPRRNNQPRTKGLSLKIDLTCSGMSLLLILGLIILKMIFNSWRESYSDDIYFES